MYVVRTYIYTYLQERCCHTYTYAYSVRCLCRYLLRFIKGFITRNQPPCPENMQFLEFVRTNWLNRLAKALPKNVLDKNWPSSPPACRDASDVLQAVYYRLVVRRYTRGLTEERKQQLQMKLEASELFKGKKSCYEESVGPYFQQSHLSEYTQKHSEAEEGATQFIATPLLSHLRMYICACLHVFSTTQMPRRQRCRTPSMPSFQTSHSHG